MYFIALATDYDGTLAHDGIVSDKTLAALERFKKSGRKLILVTGRELPDLKRVFPEVGLFDKVVAENGALIYTPASEEERAISQPPAPKFVAKLKKRGVKPLSVGRSIVATWESHQATVLEVIRKLGLELEIIFNKGRSDDPAKRHQQGNRAVRCTSGSSAVATQRGRRWRC
jgi:HAD superfamily hydrolase (TIGR01484 family)